MSIKLIAIDLDETLLQSNKELDVERFDNILARLLESGIIVHIVTGNSYARLNSYFDLATHPDIYFGADNGNYLFKDGEVLRRKGFTQAQYTAITDFLDENISGKLALSDGRENYMRETEGDLHDHLVWYYPLMNYVDSFHDEKAPAEVTKITSLSTNDLPAVKKVVDQLEAAFDDLEAVTSGGSFMDIHPIEGGKGGSVSYLMETFGLDASQVMAFGDSLNDLAMMKLANYSCAMEVADPDLVAHCNYQIGNNNDGAVLDVLEELLADPSMSFMQKYKINR